MFNQLIPHLQNKGAHVTLAPQDRLLPIYKRSWKNVHLLSAKEVGDASQYDYQLPVGSLPDRLGISRDMYATKDMRIHADVEDQLRLSKALRNAANGRKIMGISWLGGGILKRLPLKSINLKALEDIIMIPDCMFISLQYGSPKAYFAGVEKHISDKIGIVKEINPLQSMDKWLSLVECMDGVLTVANTTVHGAAGAGVKTAVLLSKTADWRWCDEDIEQGCYWYNGVDVFRENKEGWANAISDAKTWIQNLTVKP